MKLQYRVTFKRGPQTVAIVEGLPRPDEGFKVKDVTERVTETEAYLELLTGLRVHIDQVL